jgi:hypothetical protein
VNGTFIDGEVIAEISPGTGSAHVNGVIIVNRHRAHQHARHHRFSAIPGGASTWTAVFDCNGQNMRLLRHRRGEQDHPVEGQDDHRDADPLYMAGWEAIRIDAPVLTNVDETALRTHNAAIENGFITEAGNLTRFPGLVPFATTAAGKNYLDSHRGDLISVTSGGSLFRIDQNGKAEDMTSAAVAGAGDRPSRIPTTIC